jgi:catechol 2,3-dioxygenase-like lactoylglutathione lyase family enzyme
MATLSSPSLRDMKTSPFGFLRVKVIALAVEKLDRANRFYAETLGLPPAYEGEQQVGYFLGETIFMLKENWYAAPTQTPNPRITIATQSAPETEKALRSRNITVSDPVQPFDDFYVGSFLDSEGNKIWFCSPVKS